MDEEGIDSGDADFDIQNIQSVKLKFFEEVEGLFELAESLGLENNLSQRILRTANNLKRMQGVFLYVEYSDACAAKTPKLVRDLVEKTFNHKKEMDEIKSMIIHEWLEEEA
tara:strand:- start:2846 stop:3178 length:333 start_codon:yes stop_codon:yes gene_type:complete